MSQSNHSPVSQALARKWRPRDFESLVGQQHVVQALSHALDTGRLHHAYLFTGTRGVGKTTIARIMAKAVNCERGMSSKPCGVCQACTEISQGSFVDLLEVDAATNTKVDEMRQLLENAMYAPTSGRYKVYVIDEVHMLSSSAFNAMLKTLEEPPGHVLFILATTDPQKIPATVLSRCLQFGLRQLAPDQISEHLSHILQTEGIAFEPGALRLLAKAARGSLRDALSLTDQAIAYSAGQVSEPTVRQMLGAVDQKVVLSILQALAAGDGGALIALSNTLAASSAPFAALLDELAAASYRLSVAAIAGHVNHDDPDEVALAEVRGLLNPQTLQLIYQIATHARAELHLAPEESIGFGMALIRMLAFKPGGSRSASMAGSMAGSISGSEGSLADSSTSGSIANRQVADPAATRSPAAQPLAPATVATSVPASAPLFSGTPVNRAPESRTTSSPATANPMAVSVAANPVVDRPLGPAAAALAASRAMIAARSGQTGGASNRVQASPQPIVQPVAQSPAHPGIAIDKVEQKQEIKREPIEQAVPPDAPVPHVAEPQIPAPSLDAQVEDDDSEPPWVREEPMGEARYAATHKGLPTVENWPSISQQVPAKGLTRQALVQTELISAKSDGDQLLITLLTGVKAYAEAAMIGRIEAALTEFFATTVRLTMQTGQVAQTAHAVQSENRKQAMEEARASIDADPFIGELKALMGATVVQGSQRPLHEQGPADV